MRSLFAILTVMTLGYYASAGIACQDNSCNTTTLNVRHHKSPLHFGWSSLQELFKKF